MRSRCDQCRDMHVLTPFGFRQTTIDEIMMNRTTNMAAGKVKFAADRPSSEGDISSAVSARSRVRCTDTPNYTETIHRTPSSGSDHHAAPMAPRAEQETRWTRTPLTTPQPTRSCHARCSRQGPETAEIGLTALQELFEATVEITTATEPQDPDSALNIALKRLAAATASVLMPNWIDTFERNGGPGREVPRLLEYTLGVQLNEPADHPDAHPRDLNNRLYLRWLAHRPIDIDDATKEAFHRRWTKQPTIGNKRPSRRWLDRPADP